ncbi:MAG TPA: hypothetical protein VM186_03585 [Planctomycetota bacterium]|nr:hypothetical protein [Planctomycetota bacterium]
MVCPARTTIRSWLLIALAMAVFAGWRAPARAADEAGQKRPATAADASENSESAEQVQQPEDEPAEAAQQPADGEAVTDVQPPADADHPAAAAEKPAEADSTEKPPATPETDTTDDGSRNPFDVGAQLLRDIKAKQEEKNAPRPAPSQKLPELPIIKMTGVMIVGDNRMATAEVESYGTITVVKGDRFALRLKSRQEPFRFTVTDIEERQMTIVTDEGTEIRAVFK